MYYLVNRFFDIKVSQGELYTLSSPLDEKKTQFISNGKAFARVSVYYENADGDKKVFIPSDSLELLEDEPIKLDQRKVFYKMTSGDGVISATIEFTLCGMELHHRVLLTNLSDTPIKLLNVGLDVPCNSEVGWDESASSKVIGHHFMGGNGSHSVYIRCDGKGPFLVMMPEKGTVLSYIGTKNPEDYNSKDDSIALFVYPKDTQLDIMPQEEKEYKFVSTWASDNKDTRDVFVNHDLIDVEVVPGFTVPRKTKVLIRLRCKYDITLKADYEEKTRIKLVSKKDDRSIYEIYFDHLGVNKISAEYFEGYHMPIEFFVTESVETMIKKRASFIADKQYRNPNVWYDGLLAEWNNKTGVMLGPDNYDEIKGWRIYEVTCDDPGLSKPAFLSGKLREYPIQEEVNALEYYVEHFVWGGLQQTQEEPYPYGIYGIPDWYTNRNSKDEGAGGKLHIWRIYDYPHIALMYYNLYRIAKDYKTITTKLSYEVYLNRAYRTALAMFMIPAEIEEWSAYKTGLYNECTIPDIIKALETEGKIAESLRLAKHWDRKVKYFVLERSDIFKSEYPFDTTGFESTHYFAKEALAKAEFTEREDRWNPPIDYRKASAFMENQTDCNISCRGWLEPAYFLYGSDYRGKSHSYLLSYMSQMGGATLLDYALYYASEPYEILRLAYGSMLSSWALLNSGDEESNYGYWFPGKEHDGAAGGGFEGLDHGHTWLGQEHHGGSWYYSCEIDLGYCGALRGNATILAEDPEFGTIVYGGTMEENKKSYLILSQDGIGRRFHYIGERGRIHIEIDKGHFSKNVPIIFDKDQDEIVIHLDESGLKAGNLLMKVVFEVEDHYEMNLDREAFTTIQSSKEVICQIPITGKEQEITFKRVKNC